MTFYQEHGEKPERTDLRSVFCITILHPKLLYFVQTLPPCGYFSYYLFIIYFGVGECSNVSHLDTIWVVFGVVQSPEIFKCDCLEHVA